MGRWKLNGDGSPQYDANDSGPDQTTPPSGDTSGGGGGSNPYDASGGSQNGPQAGWGPIKISGTFNPHPNDPGTFWSHIGQMKYPWAAPAQGGGIQPPQGGMPPGGSEGPGGIGGNNQDPGMHPVPFPGHMWPPKDNFPGPIRDFPPYGQFPPGMLPWAQRVPNNAGTPTPNEGESYDEMVRRFQNDYHAPDKEDVMRNIINNDPNPIYRQLQHTMDQNGSNGGGPIIGMRPHGGGGLLGGLGGALGGIFGGGGGGAAMSPLIQALLKRKMQGF